MSVVAPLVVALGAAAATPPLIDGFQATFAILLVCALLALFIWLLRRGTLALGRGAKHTMTVESTLSLGERRALMVVSVEGRRLLLGVTSGQVSLVTELAAAAPSATTFPDALHRRLDGGVEGVRS